MNELEQYIRAHAAEFDSAEPPRGHEERFLKRLETAGQSRRNGPSWRIFMATLAVAASLTAVWLVVRNRPFLGTGSSPEAIYQAYMDQVARLYDSCPMEDSADRDRAVAAFTEEDVPLFEQLPEEMPRREKARILKQYYGSLLQGAQELANL